MTASVLLGYQNIEKRVENTMCSIFGEIQGVWILDETLSSVLYIFSIELKMID